MQRIEHAVANGTVNAAGEAEVAIGPGRANEVWEIVGYSVRLSTGDGELRVYENSISDGNFLEGTYDASQNASDRSTPIVMGPNERLVFHFINADIGAGATARVRYRAVQ